MHFLITGHTGFKGSWLSLMLKHQGHEVSGISLKPTKESLFVQANLKDTLRHDLRIDIRNRQKLQKAFKKVSPDAVIHLAAQPLVRRSYLNPSETFETNVIGTLNVLESLKFAQNLKSAIIVTTDKVYKNLETHKPYDENCELGGDDPYSSSKAAADLLTQSWIKSFAKIPIGIARAGNVIGGGDWAEDRLIPDMIKSVQVGEVLKVRNPDSIRPWQHVLDCLHGYLKLNEYLLNTKESGCWNFGPENENDKTVERVLNAFSKNLGQEIAWRQEREEQPHEAGILTLDSKKARTLLKWSEAMKFEQSIEWTVNWYRDFLDGVNPEEISRKQVSDFFNIVQTQKVLN